MADSKEHLDLPNIEDSFKRKKRKGGPLTKIDRNYKEFAKKQISKLDKIGEQFSSEIKKIPNYNQEIVFKIKTASEGI